MLNFLKNIGPVEIIILVVIFLLLFGSRIVVGIGKAAGNTLREIKKIRGELTGVENTEDKK